MDHLALLCSEGITPLHLFTSSIAEIGYNLLTGSTGISTVLSNHFDHAQCHVSAITQHLPAEARVR